MVHDGDAKDGGDGVDTTDAIDVIDAVDGVYVCFLAGGHLQVQALSFRAAGLQ